MPSEWTAIGSSSFTAKDIRILLILSSSFSECAALQFHIFSSTQFHKCYQGIISTGTRILARPIVSLTAGCSCGMLSSVIFVTTLTRMDTSAVLLWAPADAEVPK